MIKMRCDRCKKDIEEARNIYKLSIQSLFGDFDFVSIDICKDCLPEVVSFAKSNETPKNINKEEIKNDISEDTVSMSDKILELLQEGYRNRDVANILNCSPNYVSSVRYKLIKNGKLEKEENNNQEDIDSVETENLHKNRKIDLGKLKALLNAGWSYEKIARTEFFCTVQELKDALQKYENKTE